MGGAVLSGRKTGRDFQEQSLSVRGQTARKSRLVFGKEGGHTVSPFLAPVVLSIVSKGRISRKKA